MKKICVITGSRAEYGILKPLIDGLLKEENLKLQLIVTGSHLSNEFGSTYKQIQNDGIKIDEKIEILLSSDTEIGISKSMGLATIGFAESFSRLKPDLIVLLGDRYEIFCAASAALIARLPIAHISGGDLTEGAFDDAIRHSITKMSNLHFTTTEIYRKRVIQLGEDPSKVFNVGNLAIDNIKNMKLMSKDELEKDLRLKFKRKNILITYHPVTLEANSSKNVFTELLNAMDKLDNTLLIFTKSNADVDGRIINNLIDEYVLKNPQNSRAYFSLGQLRYLSTLNFVDAVIGNSSSGIIEVPSFNIGTVNIGTRQKGRLKPGSVIDCDGNSESISQAINKLYSPEFKKSLLKRPNIYGDGKTTERIIKIIKAVKLNNIVKKKFYDIDFIY